MGCVTGGRDWREVSYSLSDMGKLYTWVLVLYIVFTVFCVLNVMNAVFVEAAIECAQNNKALAVDKALHTKVALIDQVFQWFAEADKDKSQTVSLEELRNLLADDKVRSLLRANNFDVPSASQIFRLLDRQGAGEIGPEDFVDNLISLQGSAKAMDLASLHVDFEDMAQRIFEVEIAVRDACTI